MTQIDEKLRSAENSRTPHEYIQSVKAAVIDELVAVDRDVKIEDTGYFNHSAIPDLVLDWRDGSREGRDLYLRDSYLSVTAADDVQHLGDDAPILMALKSAGEQEARAKSRTPKSSARRSRETLLTDVRAMGALSPSRSYDTPVAGVVRSNFLRGAQGLINTNEARALVGEGNIDESIIEVVREHFGLASAARIERSALLTQAALDGNLGMFEAVTEDGDHGHETALPTGHLSAAEIRGLLPWLLTDDRVTDDERFWRYIGGLMSLADLEAIADRIAGVDVTRLISANADTWSARRAYLGIEVRGDSEPARDGVWAFRGRIVGASAGDSRVMLATDARHLNGRTGGRSPRWEEIAPQLADFSLTGVQLRGLTRSIGVSAERSDDIREDINRVTGTVGDDYFVDDVTVRVQGTGEFEPVDVEVAFARGIVQADGATSIRELSRLALDLLDHRGRVTVDTLFDGTGS